ncbi:cytidine deaminase-like protein, partial [Globomyces pollinis-pini]
LIVALAEEAYSAGEVPVGCVFVHQGKVIGRGRNMTNLMINATKHAELVAIESLDVKLLPEMDLYVTIEPCLMCASALRMLGIRHVYFGAGNEKFGGNGTVFNLHKESVQFEFTFYYPVTSGILKDEAIIILRKFYIRENENAPVPRKKTSRVLKPIK